MADITDRGSLTREDRSFTTADIEVREESDVIRFEGIASSVDSPYSVRDAFGEFEETIVRGAFNRTIKQKSDVRLLVNHEGVPIARTKSDTLSLTADPHLRASAPSLDPSNPTVQELRSALGRGDIDQMSIGMRVKDQEWNDDYTVRTIREVELLDVSIVTYPANPQTAAALRSFEQIERALQAGDLTEDELRRLIANAESLLPTEVVEERDEEDPTVDLLAQFWDKRLTAA